MAWGGVGVNGGGSGVVADGAATGKTRMGGATGTCGVLLASPLPGEWSVRKHSPPSERGVPPGEREASETCL